ncbi:rhodanese-like domain-containing protein [Bacillus sp. S/N-304-OC-R1]|uniref:rhodanese-like domain-containing protein n=1 Tax=Bacillus sp. S/N-304-OC-R1 TaxID=2758034 RepID=UPI001C8DF0E9|nr:rhodanese-like domain-containing protein [Bacillus sp. S/N-304-OC-R1]MBY0120456.1 rhodanese-like domain-containing protein [Bacillus sp. S/N-304-OC-R1]
MRTITPAELADKLAKNEEVTVLDVRSPEKYNSYHIESEHIHSLNIEKTAIFALHDDNNYGKISSLPMNKEIIVTCTTGNSARKCADILSAKGYEVTLLSGGITAWKENNQ